MLKKYYLQILVVLLLITIAWVLLLIEKTNKPLQASINQTQGDKIISTLPVIEDAENNFLPIRNWAVTEPEISAKSAVILNFKNDRKDSALYQKNTGRILPIASLTKLMTAIVVMENYDLEKIIEISENSILVDGTSGGLVVGEKLKIKDLLYIMLVQSSNDAAMSLAQDNPDMPYESFINLMNIKATELGLMNTNFKEPVGLDSFNQSTTSEIAVIAEYVFQFPLLAEILKTSEATIYSTDKNIIHKITNTNQLLGKIPQLIGGKTGYTGEAGGCLMTISNIESNNYLITVVLGSTQREIDTEKLIDWAQTAWIWQ
jgi:D-alanyl-D-alanine carboxypeptidase